MPGIPTGHFAVKSGQMMTSEDNFVITITGKGGHASMPHMTIDPMVIGAESVLALQTIVSRSISPADWGVVSVTEFLTDGARNILPSTVTIKGDVRTLSADIQALIEKRMREVVDGIAKAHGATADVEYSYEFVALVNSEDETLAAIDAAEHTVGAENVDGNCRTNTVSEDFAQFLKQVPGCFILIGNGDEDNDRPLHNPFYDYKDANLVVGADYWVNLVQRQLLKG
jgi:hippurate hydrolase